MFFIGRLLKECFWDLPRVMACSAYLILLVFLYVCQRFFAPYTSPKNPSDNS